MVYQLLQELETSFPMTLVDLTLALCQGVKNHLDHSIHQRC